MLVIVSSNLSLPVGQTPWLGHSDCYNLSTLWLGKPIGDGTSLLKRRARKGLVGSNPTLPVLGSPNK